MPRRKPSSNPSVGKSKTDAGKGSSTTATPPPDGDAPLAVRNQPVESLLAFHTPEGWGAATAAAGISAEKVAGIINEIATSSRNDAARLAAVKYLIERSEHILRVANILRVVRGRETLELPEQTIQGAKVHGTRVQETEEFQLVQDSVQRTEDRLRTATAGTVLPPPDDLEDDDD